ncbi:MAG TPA: hypothetical protein VFK58_03970, partial [Sphingomicrobium sp.]|nr:hypothetical protein [Sphingomicrobium sp.]
MANFVTPIVTSLSRLRTGPSRPVRIVWGAAVALAAAAASVSAAPASAQAPAASHPASGQGVADFYRARPGRLLWFAQPGRQ